MRIIILLLIAISISKIKLSFAIGYNAELDKCFVNASQKYKVPKQVLIAIAGVESKFKASAINRNKNGSYDLGVMQINSSWFGKLAKIGISEQSLYQPCQNIMVGTWILAQNINSYGFNWVAIQRYNGSDTQLKYAQKVKEELSVLSPKLFTESAITKNNQHAKTIESKHIFLYVK